MPWGNKMNQAASQRRKQLFQVGKPQWGNAANLTRPARPTTMMPGGQYGFRGDRPILPPGSLTHPTNAAPARPAPVNAMQPRGGMPTVAAAPVPPVIRTGLPEGQGVSPRYGDPGRPQPASTAPVRPSFADPGRPQTVTRVPDPVAQSNASVRHTPEPRHGNHEGYTADQLNRAQLSGGLDKMLSARRTYWQGQR